MLRTGDHRDPATQAGTTAGQRTATLDALRGRRRRGINLEMAAAATALLWCQHNPPRAGPTGGSQFVAAFRTAYTRWRGWGP
jgi:hypothetical protein